jgi:hypothetical protein
MISTTLQYLARDKLYETEKPYSADFEVEEHNGAKLHACFSHMATLLMEHGG